MTAVSKNAKKPTRPRTAEQIADAARLRALYEAAKKSERKVTQEEIADYMGFKTQGAVSQYMTGATVLNVQALIGFATFFGVGFEEISPSLAQDVQKLGMKRPGDRFGASKRPPMERIEAALADLFIVGPAQAKLLAVIHEAAEEAKAQQAAVLAHLEKVKPPRLRDRAIPATNDTGTHASQAHHATRKRHA